MDEIASSTESRPFPRWPLPLLLSWGGLVVVLSTSGLLDRLVGAWMPAFALLVALGIALPVLAWLVSPTLQQSVEAIGVRRLTLLHIWRIPAALLFFWYGAQELLPAAFWILAGGGDLLAGIYAATLLGGVTDPDRYRRIHLFGFLDFIVAVGTGLAFTLVGDVRMGLLTTLPMALIPLFGVGLSGASHIIALAMLGYGREFQERGA